MADEMSSKRGQRFRDVLYPIAAPGKHFPQNREPVESQSEDIRRPLPSQGRPEILRGDVPGTVGQVHTLRGFRAVVAALKVNGDDRNPELITLQALASKSDDTPPDYAVTLKLSYGTGSAQHNALVSVGHGTEVTLAATGITASILLEPLFPSQTDPDTEVNVSVGFASGSRNSQSPCYVRCFEVAAGARVTVPIAPFASSFAIFGDANLTGDRADQEGPLTAVFSSVTIASSVEAGNGYQVLRSARNVVYQNNGIVAKRIFVVFGLSL